MKHAMKAQTVIIAIVGMNKMNRVAIVGTTYQTYLFTKEVWSNVYD